MHVKRFGLHKQDGSYSINNQLFPNQQKDHELITTLSSSVQLLLINLSCSALDIGKLNGSDYSLLHVIWQIPLKLKCDENQYNID